MAVPENDSIEIDPRWRDEGFSRDYFVEKAEWIARDTGTPGAAEMYFRIAGRLMFHCARDYWLAAPMFFHAVTGLEAILRFYYGATEKQTFSKLLRKAVGDGTFSDVKFSSLPDWPREFGKLVGRETTSYSEKFAKLLLILRNDYVHGKFWFHPVMLVITIQIREATDMLSITRNPHSSVHLNTPFGSALEIRHG